MMRERTGGICWGEIEKRRDGTKGFAGRFSVLVGSPRTILTPACEQCEE